MITPCDQSGWAERLADALEDSTTSLSTIVYWLRSNVGHLNSLIGTDYGLSGEYITGDWGSFESGIYNELYFCYYLRKQSIKMVGALEYDWKEIDGEDQGKIKVVTRTDKSKIYKDLYKDCEERITSLVKTYKRGGYTIPKQILYNSRNSVSTTGMHSPPYPFSDINFSV